jgi:hypothetical protein
MEGNAAFIYDGVSRFRLFPTAYVSVGTLVTPAAFRWGEKTRVGVFPQPMVSQVSQRLYELKPVLSTCLLGSYLPIYNSMALHVQ